MSASVFNSDVSIRSINTSGLQQADFIQTGGSTRIAADNVFINHTNPNLNDTSYNNSAVLTKADFDPLVISDWQPLPLYSGVSAAQYERPTPSIRKIGTTVYVEGSVTFTRSGSGNQQLASFSEEYRPQQNVYKLVALTGYRCARICYTWTGVLYLEWISQLDSDSFVTSGNIAWVSISAHWNVLDKYEK